MKACIFHHTCISSHKCKFWFWHPHLFLSFSISIFFSRFLRPMFPASRRQLSGHWHLRHRFHSYNIGDNLLYHPIASETRVSFRFVGFASGKVDVSRLGSFVYRVHAPPIPLSIFPQFSIYLLRRRRDEKYLRNALDDVPSKIEKRVPLLVVSVSRVIDSANRFSSLSPFLLLLLRCMMSLSFLLYFLAFLSLPTKIGEKEEKKESCSSWQCQCLRRCNEILSVQLKPRI